VELQLDATPDELHVFLAETTELLDGLDAQLVRLEQDGPSDALLQEIFRAAHTIKGSSAAIGHVRMARLTHAWETLLDKLRHGELTVSAALVDRFFGVELPAERLARSKPESARVRLAAEHVESAIVILVEDDGAGVDAERIRQKAVERGMLTADAAARLSESDALDLIFAPGFSTATEVSDISGRGVGMDIVRTNVERLGGSVEIHTTLGRGTRFVLRLPLTLAIVQALLVRVAGDVYALPLSSVTETLRVRLREIQRMHRQEAILLRGRVLPLVRLNAVFGAPDGTPPGAKDALVVAVRVGDRQIGRVVDALLGEQEVVIKALGPVIGQVPGISSAAILGDGAVALIVDVPSLIQQVVAGRTDWRGADGREQAEPALAMN
jgi:chemotaxis protein histidine kinase CheA